ncbi:hypothetical protein EZS27_011995 [termite gut metagenome]|uniref:Uncharacterized protein n=1 Tax=termite gut metagenome TaxID=433724 RepID=A0A5J4S481_9ZZZZ
MKTCKDCKLMGVEGKDGETRFCFCAFHQQEVNESDVACEDILEK